MCFGAMAEIEVVRIVLTSIQIAPMRLVESATKN
jgi:hypothetical protein